MLVHCQLHVQRLKGFNPRPALRPGDALNFGPSGLILDRFNPRPALRPGDASLFVCVVCRKPKFQSAPGLEAGRCGEVLTQSTIDRFVSIRARP